MPSFVRRAATRVLIGGLLAAALVAVGGRVWNRLRFGADANEVRQRIAVDVRRQFAELADRLERAAGQVRSVPDLATLLGQRDPDTLRRLFDSVAQTASNTGLADVAITVYGLNGQPIAWAGRPAEIPPEWLAGGDALFLGVSPLGLRLVRVSPVADAGSADRRVAAIVAETPLPRTSRPLRPGEGFVLATAIIPVELRPRFEGAPQASPEAIVVTGPRGELLATVEVPSQQVDNARARAERTIAAIHAAVATAMLLLLTGPLLDWRRLESRVGSHLALTAAVAALLVGARTVSWIGVRLAGLDVPSLAPPDVAGPFWIALASPLDFLLSALFLAAWVALAASSFEQWRHSRRLRVRVIPGHGIARLVSFLFVQLAAGAIAGALIAAYQVFLRTRLTAAPVDILHFSLHPWDPARLPVVVGLILLHAALVALAVLVFRVARSPWVFASHARALRWVTPVLWAAPSLLVITSTDATQSRLPVVPAALVLTLMIVAAWRLRRYRAALQNWSQAARLAAFFVALAVPSIVFYPSLVDAAARARQQLVETRYATEVTNHRVNLLQQLQQALKQIDAFPTLDAVVKAAEPSPGPPSTEAAFTVWSRTVLSVQRLTSSIELYDDNGALVSRFALKLPEAGGTQISQEASCNWEIFGEASPFFSEERVLLHAGRGLCYTDADGRPAMAGSIVVHVALDYSNLSFLSAQTPYVALLRGGEGRPADLAPREAVEFTMYGWSRRPLYMSGRGAWPLTEPVFSRILASREPFWAEVDRGGDTYEVYFLNDRAAIHALGYPRTSAFGHLISLAELTVLAAVTYLILLTVSGVYGSIAGRTPTSGRALVREVRATFYRKLFIAFVLAAVVPVVTLALVSRAYIAALMVDDLEMEASRTAASASRVVEDVGTIQARGGAVLQPVDDNLVVWLSRVIAQDVNVFEGPELLASSERNLFASGLLPTRTPGDVYRAITLEGRPSHVIRETVGDYEYLVAAAPVRVQNRDAILTVPLTLRQQEIESQTDQLDRRVILAVVLFIILGAGIGYSMAERIADPVNRLMRATARIARGDLDARILATSSDEFRRLVEAFNRMAADLQRQRVELERSNRLAAWADMARQVAHDIKNPLTPIQLNAEHLRRVHQDRGEPLSPVLEDCVQNILTQVKLLRQIAGEFSSFASSPTARPSPSSLHQLATEVLEPYRAGLADRIAIESHVPETLPLVMVDKTLLTRALTNIIENALHAMPGGGTLRVTAERDTDTTVKFVIGDTGIGMDAEALSRIFEPYFSTRAAGTGLGLTIAKRNVELNNGTIAVESRRGVGTTVILTLPIA